MREKEIDNARELAKKKKEVPTSESVLQMTQIRIDVRAGWEKGKN